MRQDKLSKQNIILYLCGMLPVVWIALLIAPHLHGGLPEIIQNFGSIMNDPLHIQLCEDSTRAVLICLLIYGIGLGIYLSNDRNYRRREEHGSARWGNAQAVNRKYADKIWSHNKILTQNCPEPDVPDRHLEVSADGWSENSPSHRPPEDQCVPYPYYRISGCVYAF